MLPICTGMHKSYLGKGNKQITKLPGECCSTSSHSTLKVAKDLPLGSYRISYKIHSLRFIQLYITHIIDRAYMMPSVAASSLLKN